MMGFIKRIFQKNAHQLTDERQKTLFNLSKLQREHSFVDVRFPARADVRFHSMILDVDPENNLVTLDELYPRNQARRVEIGDVVEITSRTRGIKLGFLSQVEKVRLSEGEISYDIQLPENVRQKQKRNNFRVNIPQDAGIKLYLHTETELMCSVLNISTKGIGLVIAGNLSQELEKQTQLHDCLLELPEQPAITCSINIRSVEFKSRPTSRTIVGALLENINTSNQKKLDQYVASIQRLQRQQELRIR